MLGNAMDVMQTCFYLLCQMAMKTLVAKVYSHDLRKSLTNISHSATAMSMMEQNKTS
jgi:hypothetical protein